MPVTAFYAGLLAAIFILLSVRVIGVRRSDKIAIGDGGNATLIRRMRVHANFAEYVPLTLVLLALSESVQVDARILHALGIALVIARCLHAYGMSQPKEDFRFRVAGVATTFGVMVCTALLCFFGSLWHGTVF